MCNVYYVLTTNCSLLIIRKFLFVVSGVKKKDFRNRYHPAAE